MGNDEIVAGFDDEKCSYLTIRLERVDGDNRSLVLNLTGSIDTYNAGFMRRGATKAIGAGFVNLILHLGGVDYVSSAGIGVFIALLPILKEKGGSLSMVAMQPKVKAIFKLMCLETYFQCMDTPAEALSALGMGPKRNVFPSRFTCPICDKGVVAARPGRFRCPVCKSVLVVDEAGAARLA